MKRKAAIMMVALMTAGLLGACGGKEDSTGSSSAGNTNKESSEVTGTTTSDEETERTDLKDIKVEDYVTLGEYKNIAVTVSAQAQVEDSDGSALDYAQAFMDIGEETGVSPYHLAAT